MIASNRWLIASLLALVWLAPGRSTAEGSERFSVSVGGFFPSGDASLGTLIGLNVGQRVSDSLRLGAEVLWYRREYESSFLLVEDAGRVTGQTIPSVASTQLFPLLATADYYIPARADSMELYLGGGVGLDWLRTKQYPRVNLASFTRNHTGLGYMIRGGVSTHAGRGLGAVYVEGFLKGSTIDGDDRDPRSGEPLDVEARASGLGFRVGFRW